MLVRGNIIAVAVAVGLAACGGRTELDSVWTGEATGSGGTGGPASNSGSGGLSLGAGDSAIAYAPESLSCAGTTGSECNGESCCTTIVLPAGSFPMGRGTETCSGCTDGCPSGISCLTGEQPEHPATVSSFALDKYEVTVGRFRNFMDAFQAGWRPTVGEGANAAVESAQGLSAGATGWKGAWDVELPSTGYQETPGDRSLEDRITCYEVNETSWTDTAGANEQYPMNCVSWYEAFAFCIWDRGRLPTEAEWEYAAAGGDENRLYPWGAAVPDATRANYDGYLNGVGSPFIPVGNTPLGNGRWGHADLAGSMWEWVLDWYAEDWYTTTEAGCSDCVNLTAASTRVVRGGYWSTSAGGLRAAERCPTGPAPTSRGYQIGWRCSRSAP